MKKSRLKTSTREVENLLVSSLRQKNFNKYFCGLCVLKILKQTKISLSTKLFLQRPYCI